MGPETKIDTTCSYPKGILSGVFVHGEGDVVEGCADLIRKSGVGSY